MPRIAQYEATVDKLQPSQIGAEGIDRGGEAAERAAQDFGRTAGIQSQTADVFARLARYRGSLGEELASSERITAHDFASGTRTVGDIIDRHNTMQDISTGSAALASAHNQLTNDWNTTVNQADINDHTIADKFNKESLEPFLEKWQAGFSTEEGQKWALSQADALRDHFYTKQSADMMTRQGDAAIVNFNTTVNGLSQTAHEDPTSAEHSMGILQATVDGLIGQSGLSTDQASKLRTETLFNGQKQIAIAALQGTAEKNPEAAEAAIHRGDFKNWLNDSETHQALNYVKAQQQAAATAAREDRILANQAREDTYRQNGAALLSGVTAGSDGRLIFPQNFAKTVIDTAGKGGLPLDQAKGLIDWQQREQQSDLKVDRATTPGLVNTLLGRLDLPEGDPNKITSPSQLYGMVSRTDGGPNLSTSDFKFMSEQINSPDRAAADPVVKSELDRAGQAITGLASPNVPGGLTSGATEPAIRQAMDQFKVDTLRQLQAVKTAGGDTRPYLDPNSQQYLFSKERIQQYVPSKADIASHYFSGVQPVAPTGRPALPDIRMLFAAPPPKE